MRVMTDNKLRKAKEIAAKAALNHISTNQILGLGSGSTIAIFAKKLKEKIEREKIKVKVVPSSYQALLLAYKYKFPVIRPSDVESIDITVDGADEIDRKLFLIKGGGAALTREKIIAYGSRRYIIVADYTKLVNKLGEKHPLPIEILKFGWKWTVKHLERYGKPLIRTSKLGKVGPVITDNGNFIVDLYLNSPIEEPREFENELKSIPGVVEVGIFTRKVDVAYIGYEKAVRKLVKAPGGI